VVTSRDVARRAGLSQATVSRVLTGHPGVQAETRAKVLQAVRETKYSPNAAARAMRTSRTGNIGVVVARLANPLYPELLQILGRQLAEDGLRMVVWNADEADDGAPTDAVREGRIDGVLFTTATEASTRLYEALTHKVPVALINRTVDGWPCDQVSSDNRGGGRSVAAYFVGAGRRRIGLLSGPLTASTIRDREAGFREGLGAAGVQLDATCCARVEVFSYKTGFDAMTRILELAAPPDAVFCVNDIVALGARDAARVRGVGVPDSLWLVGYDDIEMAAWHAFDLTTVRQPLEDMTRETVQLLRARIQGQAGKHQHICLPNDLVIRGSTARHPVPR
jgi:LacI family transcriptional regulator